MSAGTYTRFELLRTLRNRRFFIFSLAFPVILFLVIAGPNRHQTLGGIPFALYYMTGMITFGTMTAVMAGGGRIALEREVGWNRQLKITPLTNWAYFQAKLLTGYVMAAISIVLLYGLGSAFGVRLSLGSWLTMTGLILVGLIPFAILGVLLGHLMSADTLGPALGGITSIFALLGGAWGPFAEHGALNAATKLLPSYWLVQAGKSAFGNVAWPAEGWIVIAVWSAILVRLAILAYRRDTGRA
jgi:ABC-2 type transport system permease protein